NTQRATERVERVRHRRGCRRRAPRSYGHVASGCKRAQASAGASFNRGRERGQMREWTSPLEDVSPSTGGSSEASARLLRSRASRPVYPEKGSMVNVWPARVPVNTVPVTGPLLTTVTVRSGATVYVNDAWVSLDPAPPRVTGVSGWVRLTE